MTHTESLDSSAAPPDDGLSALQRAQLLNMPCDRLFAVISWGAAATRWLAKTLDSHPEVLCLHAGSHAIASFGRPIEAMEYYRALTMLGHGYRAAGDVHGIGRHDVPALRKAFGDRFQAVVLVREPIARLHSLMAHYDQFRGLDAWGLSYVDDLVATRRLTLPDGEDSRMFIHAANMLNAIVEERAIGRVYKTEELTSSAETLAALVRELGGGDIEPTAEWLAAGLRLPRINAHESSRERVLTDWQREVLGAVVTEDAWRMYAQLGYPVASFA